MEDFDNIIDDLKTKRNLILKLNNNEIDIKSMNEKSIDYLIKNLNRLPKEDRLSSLTILIDHTIDEDLISPNYKKIFMNFKNDIQEISDNS